MELKFFPKKKLILFHTPSKLNVFLMKKIILFLPKMIILKNNPMINSNSNGDKNYVN
jgi:hypothetical protein